MITLLVEAGVLAPGRQVELDESERHHLKVRRARAGERVRLLDGSGGVGEGTLVGSPSAGRIHVVEFETVPAPVRRGLAVAAGDRDRFVWLVEKAAELGVTDVLPLETGRTAGVATRIREQQVERLQRRALEAIKQSGSAWAPVVHPPRAVDALATSHADGVRWLADPGGEAPSRVSASEPAWAAIGPEGGFTDAERVLLERGGWKPVRLGRHILRFETAAVVAAALMTSHDS
jgi:16S rRNA (uracil1498-N3)-methyltransferase